MNPNIPLLASAVSPEHPTPPTFSSRFETPRQRWVYLIIVCFFSCLATGPVTSWPTFEPILGTMGVLGSTANQTSPQLDQVYAIGAGAQVLISLPAGIIYDVAGPSMIALLGGLMSALGLTSMGLSISYPSYNWWLYWAYPLTVGGGGLISYSVLGWTWLLPAHQTMIGAMIGAVNQISDALALPGVYLVNNNICTLQFFFYLLAISSIFSAFVIYLISPSHAENARHFEIANGFKPHDTDTIGCMGKTKQVWHGLVKSKDVILLFPTAVVLMQINLCIAYLAMFYPSIEMYDYFNAAVGETEAKELVNLFPVLFGVLGSFMSIASGYICDRIGLSNYMRCYTVLSIAVTIVQVYPSFVAQCVWMILWTLSVSSFIVIYMRFAMRYAPFEIFGSFMGLLATIMPLVQMCFGPQIGAWMHSLYPDKSDVRRYTVIYTILNVLNVISCISLVICFMVKPPPDAGSVIMGEDGQLRVVDLLAKEGKK